MFKTLILNGNTYTKPLKKNIKTNISMDIYTRSHYKTYKYINFKWIYIYTCVLCHQFLSGDDFYIIYTVAHFYAGNKANLDITMVSFFVSKNKCPLGSFDRFSFHFNHGCQIVQAVCYCHVCIPSPRQQHHNYILLYCYINLYSIIREICHIFDSSFIFYG